MARAVDVVPAKAVRAGAARAVDVVPVAVAADRAKEAEVLARAARADAVAASRHALRNRMSA